MVAALGSKVVLAIDPGNVYSAYALFVDGLPAAFAKLDNAAILARISELDRETGGNYTLAIEMIASYGMAVGETVFDTCVWIGKFEQASAAKVKHKIKRLEVKTHLCHSSRAKDANVRQALIDRFGAPGTSKNAGILYGAKADMWAAIAVGITCIDLYK